MPRPRLEARAGVPHKPKRAFHGLRRFVVNELGDLQLAGWWVGQSSLRVTAGYERERTERLDEARERLDRKEMAAEMATNVATGNSKSLPVLPERWVTQYSGHMGDTFCLLHRRGACLGRSVTSWTSGFGLSPACSRARRWRRCAPRSAFRGPPGTRSSSGTKTAGEQRGCGTAARGRSRFRRW